VHQIRIFVDIESNVEGLEERVNAWLKESRANIIDIFGNIAPQTVASGSQGTALAQRKFSSSDIFMVVVYEAAG
jgi:hypothetical protein